MGGNGGNGHKNKTSITIHPEPKTLEEKQKASLENKKGQYILLRLIDTLKIKPLKEKASSPTRWVTIELDGLQYDLTEVLEAALKDMEIFRNQETNL